MRRKLQFALVLFVVVIAISVASHLLTAWLGIETRTGWYWQIGPPGSRPPAYLAGSSLAGDAISWDLVSTQLDQRICGWGVAGSSPWEWERFQRKIRQDPLTIIVVSPYDLNEEFLSDFHANVVSAADTIRDLWHSGADWPFALRVLSQYPLMYTRIFFPTAGRAYGVIGGLHDKLDKMLGSFAADNSEAGPTLAFGKESQVKEYKRQRISDWSPSQLLRRLAAMRSACHGEQSFAGPKKLAFLRMLHEGQEQGRVIVVVLPVSPAYVTEFLDPKDTLRFETELADARQAVPQAQWVRLDRLPELNSNDNFWDLVHMNPDGQQIATRAFLSWLKIHFVSKQP
jgi:hypothetical protein